ncbi:MAG: DinB family protein [Chloroflexota bacterium]
MNAIDVLHYGHRTVLATVDGLADADWNAPNVCGVWSSKEIIAHLASFEVLLVDVLNTFLDDTPRPCLTRYLELGGQGFNDTEVPARRHLSPQAVLAEYTLACEQTQTLITRIPVAKRRETGTLPWYGNEYDLEDFIAYQYYGHKREHTAQINVFRLSRRLWPRRRHATSASTPRRSTSSVTR